MKKPRKTFAMLHTRLGVFRVEPQHDPQTCNLPAPRGILPKCPGCQYDLAEEIMLDTVQFTFVNEDEQTEDKSHESN